MGKPKSAVADAPVTQVAPESNGRPSKCPITRAEFRKSATPTISVTIDGVPYAAVLKEFSTGSFGWSLQGKTSVKVGETPVGVQIGLNLTCVGSKEAQ